MLQSRPFLDDEEHEDNKRALRAAMDAAGGTIERVGFLVFTVGGGPTAGQRADIRAFLGGRHLRAAVVTTSRLTRGIVKAIGWFNAEVRAFAPADVARAFRHVEVGPGDEAALWTEIDRLDEDLRLEVVAEARRGRRVA